MPYLPTSNGNVLKGLGRNAIALANGFVPGDLWEGERGHLVQTAAQSPSSYYCCVMWDAAVFVVLSAKGFINK